VGGVMSGGVAQRRSIFKSPLPRLGKDFAAALIFRIHLYFSSFAYITKAEVGIF
jgi:hypothetical protein